ncbi:MAG: hypothetical protein QOG54_696 [Actinomycetota bacterium]|jgi:hypothetical protein|nr:hypothetical protein [Actinomycetota bacterium]
MTYLMAELETVRKLKEEMLRRRRRQALIAAVETANHSAGVSPALATNTVSLDWAELSV